MQEPAEDDARTNPSRDARRNEGHGADRSARGSARRRPSLSSHRSGRSKRGPSGLLVLAALLVALFVSACQQTAQPPHPEPLGDGDTLEYAPGRTGEVKTATLMGPDGEPFTFTYEVIDDVVIVEGDMIIGTAEEFESIEEGDEIELESTVLYRRVCWSFLGINLHCENYRWPNAVVPYVIADDWNDPDRAGDENAEMRAAIRDAMDELERVSAVRFVPRSGQDDYVRFRDGSGCSATVGHQGGAQNINLNFACRNPFVIVHEMLHMLGFNHEQTRHDRNSFVEIHWDNIQGDKKHNFETADRSFDLGPYDYDSLMHYGGFSFCKRNASDACVGPTITTVPPGTAIGQRSSLSTRDIAALTAIYRGEPPTIDITGPTPGSAYSRGYTGILLQADTNDPEGKELNVTWRSNVDGLVASGNPAMVNTGDLAYGAHTLTAVVVDPQGNWDSDTVNVTITNDAPDVDILRPSPATFCIDENVTFDARVFDRNETGFTLPNASVAWRVGAGPAFATGKSVTHAFTSAGAAQVIVRATDPLGAFGEDSVNLSIADCSDQPPVVTITTPDADSDFFYDGYDNDLGLWYTDVTFAGNATDPEDGALTGGSLIWTTNRTEVQTAVLGNGTNLVARLYSDVCEGTTHTIVLTATDSFGNVRTDQVFVTIWTIC